MTNLLALDSVIEGFFSVLAPELLFAQEKYTIISAFCRNRKSARRLGELEGFSVRCLPAYSAVEACIEDCG